MVTTEPRKPQGRHFIGKDIDDGFPTKNKWGPIKKGPLADGEGMKEWIAAGLAELAAMLGCYAAFRDYCEGERE